MDGRFRFVRMVTRTSPDDRWTAVSPRDPFSVGDLEMTAADFTCSMGTRGEVNPAALRLERPPVDALPPNPDHEPVSRRLHLKPRDVLAHGTSDHCPGCRALVSVGRAQGHTEECQIRVEGMLGNTEEGRARFQAAATRVSDALAGRAPKRVRFVGDQVDGSEGSTDHATGSQLVLTSSTLPAETASSRSTSAPPAESVSSTSAADVPAQVMSEGATRE